MTMRKRMFVLGASRFLRLWPPQRRRPEWQVEGDMKCPMAEHGTQLHFPCRREKLTGTVVNTYGEEQITEGSVKATPSRSSSWPVAGSLSSLQGQVVGRRSKFHVTIGDMGEAISPPSACPKPVEPRRVVHQDLLADAASGAPPRAGSAAAVVDLSMGVTSVDGGGGVVVADAVRPQTMRRRGCNEAPWPRDNVGIIRG